MTAIYTWDVFSTLDGYGSYGPEGNWGGYWSKQGPELLAHRASLFDTEQRMVFGATTFRENAAILLSGDDPNSADEWNIRTLLMPAMVISSTLDDTPRLAECDHRQRRRRRHRQPTQGGVRGSAAFHRPVCR